MNSVEMLLGNDLACKKVMTYSPTKPRKLVRKKSLNKKLRTTNAVLGAVIHMQAKLINSWKEDEQIDLS